MRGRPKQFDPDCALDRAMMLFWERGYERTSLGDLLHAMGISRQSLYDTFGDKRSLYLAALDRYRSRQQHEIVAELFADDPSLPAIRAVFERLVASAACGQRRSCMLGSSTLERGDCDSDVVERVHATLKQMEGRFELAIRNAIAKHELGCVGEPRAVARHLVNTLQGLSVLSKGGASPEEIRDVVEVALSVLSPAPSPPQAT